MRAAALVVAAGAIAAALTWAACSPTLPVSMDSGACPNDLPAACPSSVPSYADAVAPTIGGKCNGCHTDGGPGTGKFDFSTYASVYADRSAMLNQIYSCRMPPADASALTAEERAALLSWFVCHAPNN